jgi:hypothetical protein
VSRSCLVFSVLLRGFSRVDGAAQGFGEINALKIGCSDALFCPSACALPLTHCLPDIGRWPAATSADTPWRRRRLRSMLSSIPPRPAVSLAGNGARRLLNEKTPKGGRLIGHGARHARASGNPPFQGVCHIEQVKAIFSHDPATLSGWNHSSGCGSRTLYKQVKSTNVTNPRHRQS